MQRLKQIRLVVMVYLFALAVGIFGCSIRLIAPYDQRIDDGVTGLQKTTAEFFASVERQGGTKPEDFKDHTKFYDDSRVSVSGLIVRADALANNDFTVKELKILHQQFQNLEKLDQKNGIPAAAVPQLEEAFDRTFTAILTLEVAKKEPKTGGTVQ
ncbi:MAG: hypothetical protein ABSE95_12445 [Thermodesulfobacteriota bacterium]|jgi:hypothetical protein